MEAAVLGRKSKQELIEIKNNFVVERMGMDKFFSDFLAENELDEHNANTKEWKIYKTKLADYQRLSMLINWAEYYLNR